MFNATSRHPNPQPNAGSAIRDDTPQWRQEANYRMARGRPRNLRREIQILEMVMMGETEYAIAEKLGIHRGTVTLAKRRARQGSNIFDLQETAALEDEADETARANAEVASKRSELVRRENVARFFLRIDRFRKIATLEELNKVIAVLNQEIQDRNAAWDAMK